ncbi:MULTISPECIES: 2-succinyl-5-enolpyruvyl-6-hydroxy-3-cyclohexene-1-carboxylic-acid synthase [unclassified Dehalobacter]|uniref:2-succinyl-5-enolpyruvyl-6-hydroxy-3- cyclohexene-1-carboxylic-acid synthase n=1 Tax=unclassified Dehalobacter TaxID=2635733 RepID=UPI0010428646|nr:MULTISPECIES: 2-succinyl-5-enolpyruvyl-6-hydroxy-3-cyclohexene-1-carboxylic-acid synthase [unclassified Dehalobacter]TCX50897.1 2-succinyl-5-enolpyruvyl-6-hydroxy-3-cyclohexene-1-carboxylic-acid synthase [Dehalobacter sp. 12DCB1]TCX51609.1 2-succinyl-5-enolpyruvyl-6-hydroxy-3-cyclohexene-1-carboxylic-acid synthase [Dehalobacter sp. 14DCB1]
MTDFFAATNYIAALVDELYQLGVREVVISPGSRSTPLAILFREHQFEIFVSIDERSAAFFALGAAKEMQRPVVLVCTSGSAAAHYLPALVEAKYSRVPLIVLTADRPPELRQAGAPQTIDQTRIYGEYARFFEELALPEEDERMYRYARAVMQRAYGSAMTGSFGVSHVNIPLREPLVPDLSKLDFTAGRHRDAFRLHRETLSHNNPSSYPHPAEPLEVHPKFDAAFSNKNGIIVCGGDAYADYHTEVLALAARLKAPVLADPLSNFRGFSSGVILDSYQAFLKEDAVKDELKPEYVIQFGQTPVSKSLQQYLARHQDALFVQADAVFDYRNPALSTNHYVLASPKLFAASVKTENSSREYLDRWLIYQQRMRAQLRQARQEKGLFEGSLIQRLQDLLPQESRLFAANSMAVRDVDDFLEARAQDLKVLGNRGANGIDGMVSTALGIAAAGKPTVLLTGDIAFFHDLNGLQIAKNHPLDLTILLFNNNGGGIFRYLPQSREKYFETLFLTPPGLDFSALTALYGIAYFEPKNYEEFERSFQAAQNTQGIKLIEVKIDLELSKELHDKYTRLPSEND